MKKLVLIAILIGSLFFSSKIYGQVINYADSIIDFSSQYGDDNWSANQALYEPNVYPNYGDIEQAWAPAYYYEREFLEFYFEDAIPIDSIYIYETYTCGTVDTVYIKNPNSGSWEIVYQGAPDLIEMARIFRVGFPMTSFPVSEIRIAIDGTIYDDYVEIDAVAVVNSTINPAGLTEHTLLNSTFFYPNPNEGIVNVDLVGLTDISIKVFNVRGQLIYHKENIEDSNHQFELNAKAGIYIIEISMQQEKRHYKLVKQ